MPSRTDSKNRTDHNGVIYSSIKNMCRVYGISYSTYIGRISRGMSVKEALTIPAAQNAGTMTLYDGVTYKSLGALARAYGIESATLRSRLERGIPLKEALTPPNRSVTGPDGVTYKNVADMAMHYKVSVNAVYRNMYQLKLSPADAVLLAVKTRNY